MLLRWGSWSGLGFLASLLVHAYVHTDVHPLVGVHMCARMHVGVSAHACEHVGVYVCAGVGQRPMHAHTCMPTWTRACAWTFNDTAVVCTRGKMDINMMSILTIILMRALCTCTCTCTCVSTKGACTGVHAWACAWCTGLEMWWSMMEEHMMFKS